MPTNTLETIVAYKRQEVADRRRQHSESDLIDICNTATPPRNFYAALAPTSAAASDPGLLPTRVIAEIKRRSPSAGLIRPEYDPANDNLPIGFNPANIARTYTQAGAAALSCLTDEPSFGGRLEYLQTVKSTTPLPVLRKDFIIDPWQILESRSAGADAVLLIAECLDSPLMIDCATLAHQMGMTTLFEVHSPENLHRVLPIIEASPPTSCLLGINNRDLSRMHTDIAHTLRLAQLVPNRSMLVSESGIRTHQDLVTLKQAGVSIVLVGEHLMRSPDPGASLVELLGG